jgi:hypothetical protein
LISSLNNPCHLISFNSELNTGVEYQWAVAPYFSTSLQYEAAVERLKGLPTYIITIAVHQTAKPRMAIKTNAYRRLRLSIIGTTAYPKAKPGRIS